MYHLLQLCVMLYFRDLAIKINLDRYSNISEKKLPVIGTIFGMRLSILFCFSFCNLYFFIIDGCLSDQKIDEQTFEMSIRRGR